MDKKRAAYEDSVLNALNSREDFWGNLNQVKNDTGLDMYIVKTTVSNLLDRGLVNVIGSSVDSQGTIQKRKILFSNTAVVEISSTGRYYLSIDGGSLKLYKEQKRKKIWNNIKITAAVLNAVTIISISIWAILRNS